MQSLVSVNQFKETAFSVRRNQKSFLYYATSAGNNEDRLLNEEAFKRFSVVPRMLRDVSTTNCLTSILGCSVSAPIGIAPTGFNIFAHDEGEIAVAKASSKENCLMILSCATSKAFDEVVHSSSEGAKWLQLYIFNERSETEKLVRLGEDLGFTALVLTIDSPVCGLWWRKFSPEFFQKNMKGRKLSKPLASLLDRSVVFEDILWLKSLTPLPIVVKGILSAEDALKAAQNGASAIYVSNHGGRQIDRVIPALDVLPEVVNIVKSKYPEVEIYLDGGVRTGSDVFTALALGATAVFIGKPIIWGLAVDGEEGVRKILRILKEEFIATMQLAGVRSLKELNSDFLRTRCMCKM